MAWRKRQGLGIRSRISTEPQGAQQPERIREQVQRLPWLCRSGLARKTWRYSAIPSPPTFSTRRDADVRQNVSPSMRQTIPRKGRSQHACTLDPGLRALGVLESGGVEIVLANARQLRHVPCRKVDMIDCQWLQLRHDEGLLRGSF